MRGTLTWVALAAFGLGCSNRFDSEAMALKYHPPHGVDLVDEQAGPPRVARFSNGLEIRSIEGAAPAVQEDKLEDLLKVVSPGVQGAIISARPGTIDAGQVVRWTIKEDAKRTLVYFVPRPKRYLVLTLTAPESRYSNLESQLELSLSSLKMKD